MSHMPSYREKAYAKINLYLHVLRKRNDGYHDLDSMIIFSDLFDIVTIEPDTCLSLTIDGPFAETLSIQEKDTSPQSKNILIKALWRIAEYTQQKPLFNIHLTKNIPLGAGLGGGSADAAALARTLCSLWDIDFTHKDFQKILYDLGADVPVCFHQKPCRIVGTGEKITTIPILPEFFLVLVHPRLSCSTKSVFENNNNYTPNQIIFSIDKNFNFSMWSDFINFLGKTRNDLCDAATEIIPDIAKIITAINAQNDVIISRMTGSGSCCFGLFKTKESAALAEKNIESLYPDYWVKTTKFLS